jgi:hypothetical protein
LENFNGKEIMDASWGEQDYEEEDEEEDEGPWGQTERNPQGFLRLPEEQSLMEREQVRAFCAAAQRSRLLCTEDSAYHIKLIMFFSSEISWTEQNQES